MHSAELCQATDGEAPTAIPPQRPDAADKTNMTPPQTLSLAETRVQTEAVVDHLWPLVTA